MSRYKALLFDLCDTLVTLNFSKLPTVAVNGQAIRSTSGLIYSILRESHPQITFEKFYSVLIETTRQLHLIRDEHHMEITSEHRFEKILKQLGLHQIPETKELLNRIISTHTDQIIQMMEFPESHRLFLKTCRQRYRFGIVSNFDHAATVYRVLERQGVRDLFEEILISAEVGWRKPRREIFQSALERMRLEPADTLFIGDRHDIDVVGAKQSGMAAAWLNPEDQPVRQDLPAPDLVIGSLGDLVDLP